MSSTTNIELEVETPKGKGDDGPQDPTSASALPGDVHTHQQLKDVPQQYLNLDHNNCFVDQHRPLLHTDANGNTYTYALNPLTYSVYLILVLELLERFSFYGLYMTQTNYLTGSYDNSNINDGNDDSGNGWSAGMTSMEAASLIAMSTAVAYTVPFFGGTLADVYLGDYKTILVGVLCFYLPGIFLVASSTTPNWWLGTTSFNVGAYKLALLFLWPVGTGTVKAVVNIFGARQYHPILQRSMVESFYVQFYMVINAGAVVGCIVIPVVARSSVTAAYTIPFVLLLVAVTCFLAGSKRYVVPVVVPGRRSGDCCGGSGVSTMIESCVSVDDGEEEDVGVMNVVDDGEKPNFADVAKVCALIIPFNVVYQQCPTTFMVQGAVMDPFLGFIESPSMNIVDSISVLVSGYFVSSYFYPFLARNNIKLATGYKFALGSALGGCAILWSLLLEEMIHAEYVRSGGRVNVVWQAPGYFLIGAGEIFSISTAYEVAFTASPPNKKAFACAFNLFCIGGIPSMLSLGLYRMCDQWFQNNNGSGNIGRIKDYSEAHVANYFWVLFGIVMFGVSINLLPPVRAWIASVENRAAKASSGSAPSTPSVGKRKPVTSNEEETGETERLLKAQKHIKYLEEGTDARIYRMNTMKAEFSKKPR